MKKYILFSIFFPAVLFSQIQVSDIKYDFPRDDYSHKGFIKVGQEEYFIEQGDEGTKVSLVKETDLLFLHELKFRPTDSRLNIYCNSSKNNNSGLINEGPVLYEIYYDYVYLVDIISGQLIEVVDLKTLNLQIRSNFEFGKNFLFFSAFGKSGMNPNVRIDKISKKIDTLNNSYFIVESKQFWISDDKSKLQYRDLETNQIFDHPTQFSNIEFIKVNESDPKTRIIIKDKSGIHLLNDNNILSTLSCPIPEMSSLAYISDDIIAYETNNGDEVSLTVIEKSNCTEVYTTSFPIKSLSFKFSVFDHKTIFNDFFVFGYPNDWQGNGLYYLYDIKNKSASEINIPIDFPLLDRSVRYGDNLYFLTINDIHYIGDRPELYKLTLLTDLKKKKGG